MKLGHSFWWLLVVGILLRCQALTQPLLDAHNARQCQTAAACASMIAEPGWHFSAKIPWAGDLPARYVLELPVYNYLAIAVHWLSGNLDLSGKVASLALWIVSFFFLQEIWRRLLDPTSVTWTNLLFVVAPLSVFYGQAFMPEMLIQALAFAFVLLIMLYDEKPTIARWVMLCSAGLLGLLIKLPEFSHLYLILGVLVLRREGWKALLRPQYLLAAFLTVLAMHSWSHYVETVNRSYLPEWTPQESLRVFVGTWEERFEFRPWAMVFLYLGAFIVPGPAALAAVHGLWVCFRGKERANNILGLWLLSLGFSYLFWFGNGAARQSYYNLPTLAPLCALFGLGMSAFLASIKLARWRAFASVAAVVLTLAPAIPVWTYLFRQDEPTLAAARWVRDHTAPGDLILFRPNHHWASVDYPYNPALAYYSGRFTFVWTRNTPELFRHEALTRAHYAVVTLPSPAPSGLLEVINRFRRIHRTLPESVAWLEEAGFQEIVKEDRFVVFQKQ